MIFIALIGQFLVLNFPQYIIFYIFYQAKKQKNRRMVFSDGLSVSVNCQSYVFVRVGFMGIKNLIEI